MPFRRTIITLTILLTAALILCAGLNSGSQTCPSSGNKAVIASSSSCPSSTCKASTWTIQAPSANTGKVYVGGSTIATTNGVYLNAGDSATLSSGGTSFPFDLTQTFIACSVSADTVTFNYTQ